MHLESWCQNLEYTGLQYICVQIKLTKLSKQLVHFTTGSYFYALHYYVRIGTMDTDDRPGSWRQEPRSNYIADLVHQGSNHPSRLAEQRRTNYKNYFIRKGAVPWQSSRIF